MSGWQLKELIGVVALVVAIVALFKDPIMAYVFRPRLHIEFDQTNGADFHRIPVNFVANSGELVGQVPSYYARLRVRNTKGSTAQMVEVSVISLSRRDLSGTYVPIGTFLPLNLKWSHVGTTHRERSLARSRSIATYSTCCSPACRIPPHHSLRNLTSKCSRRVGLEYSHQASTNSWCRWPPGTQAQRTPMSICACRRRGLTPRPE